MMDGEKKIAVNMVVPGEDRIRAMDAMKARDHSSRSAILNKALDVLIEKNGGLDVILAGEVTHA